MIQLIKRSLYLLLLLCLGTGCESFLDEKPNKQQVVPSTLTDLQALLDNYPVLNHSDPSAGEVSSDDYYLTDSDWAGLWEDEERRMYTWQPDRLFLLGSNEWFYAYRPVYTANTVLEGITRLERTPSNQAVWDNIKGQALFIRARSFLQVATIWAQAYDANTASTDLGIPLRLNTDFDEKSKRASLKDTYSRIDSDLQEAATLLSQVQVHPVRPSRAAAYALLARTHLYMRQFEQAASYANAALGLQNTLLDFNNLSLTATFPIPQANREVLYRSVNWYAGALEMGRAKIVPTLYESYTPDDLRREVFYQSNGDGTYSFRGSYDGNSSLFSGISTNEVYLTLSEALARQGDLEQAMNVLNTLLVTRWKTGTFSPYAAATTAEAMQIILSERRKELPMRGLRWMDIKRLNKEGANIGLSRTVNGETYTLPPNDMRFALPIPQDVIELSGMPQNPR